MIAFLETLWQLILALLALIAIAFLVYALVFVIRALARALGSQKEKEPPLH